MRVMLDTSTVISLFIFKTESMDRFKACLVKHQVILCSYVIDETKDVVERKFPTKRKALDEFLRAFPFIMSYTPDDIDDSDYPAIRDELDLPILASAILEDVDVLISRDKDFLAVETERPEILAPEDFCMQHG